MAYGLKATSCEPLRLGGWALKVYAQMPTLWILHKPSLYFKNGWDMNRVSMHMAQMCFGASNLYIVAFKGWQLHAFSP